MGRPSLYTDELAEAICERLSKGEPLARICDSDGMPDFSTVWRWEQSNEAFRKLSARAREVGTHYLADQCINIADAPGDPADKRIRIDTRLRLIGKWNARSYGDSVNLKHTDGTGQGPVRVVNLTDEQLAAIAAGRGAGAAGET